MVRSTIENPQEGARAILALQQPRRVLIDIAALLVIANVFTAILINVALPIEPNTVSAAMLSRPVLLALGEGALFAIFVLSVSGIGRAFGGQGTLDQTLQVMVWLQMILFGLRVVQVALAFVLPTLSGMVGIGALLLFVWLYLNFVAVLHGFRSLGLIFAISVMSAMGIVLITAFVGAALGITPPGV